MKSSLPEEYTYTLTYTCFLLISTTLFSILFTLYQYRALLDTPSFSALSFSLSPPFYHPSLHFGNEVGGMSRPLGLLQAI